MGHSKCEMDRRYMEVIFFCLATLPGPQASKQHLEFEGLEEEAAGR